MRVTMQTFDKCVGTDDAPWLIRTVDSSTDAPVFASTLISSATQTGTINVRIYKFYLY